MPKKIIRNSILNAAAGMTMLVTGFASSVITARLLGPEANGLVAFAFWLTTTGTLIAGLGSDVLLGRMLPQLTALGFDERQRRGFAAYLAQFVLIAVLAFLAAFVLLNIGMGEPVLGLQTEPLVVLTGLLFVFQAIGTMTVNVLIGEQRPLVFIRLTLVASVFQLIVTVAGAEYYGVAGALGGYVASYLVFFVYAVRLLAVRPDPCGTSTATLMRASLFISLGTVIESIFLNRIELAFLQHFQGVHTVGFYAIGLTLANLALQLPVQLSGTLVPYYTELAHARGNTRLPVHLFEDVIRILAYMTMPMALGLAAISWEVVKDIFGDDFGGAGTMVALLALSAPLSVFSQISTKYLFAIGQERPRLIIGVVGAVTISVGCLVVVPAFAGEGAAAVRIAMLLVMSALMVRRMDFEGSLMPMFASLIKITLASALCAVTAFLLSRSIDGLAGTALAIVAGAFVYLIGLRMLSAVPAKDAEALSGMAQRLPRKGAILLRSFAGLISGIRIAEPPRDETRMDVDVPDDAPVLTETAPAHSIAATPVTFGHSAGFYMPCDGSRLDHAVLFVSPFGFEDLSTRKFWRILAERLSDAGVSSLRFDLPDTGNALDIGDGIGLEDWQDALVQAVAELRRRSGAERVIIVAQGLGAALAATVWDRLGPLSGIALLAPVVSGKAYLRELAVWARITDGQPDPERELREGRGFFVSGFRIPDRIHAALKTINLASATAPACGSVFLAPRPDRPAEADLASIFTASGASVEVVSFDGYEKLASNLNFSEQPEALMRQLVAWVTALPANPSARPPDVAGGPAELHGDGFVERPVSFGAGGRLVGTLCEPADGQRSGATVLLLSTAYHPAYGWGRIGTGAARRLARLGIASLRFDAANSGDSPALPGAPQQILYSPAQGLDVAAALDLVERRGLLPAVIAGRCSGGYLAFRSLLADPRLRGAISANPYTFVWDGSKNVEDLLRFVPKPLGNYGALLFRRHTWRRMLKGEIAIGRGLRNIVGSLAKRALHASETVLQTFPFLSREYRDVHQAFAHLKANDRKLILLYADDDPSVAHLTHHFGEGGCKLKGFDNVSLRFLTATDHNLSTPEAREIFVEEMVALARTYPPAPQTTDEARDEELSPQS